MQKYDAFPGPVQQLGKISAEIQRLLDQEQELLGDSERMAQLDVLYGERQKLIDAVTQWLETPGGKDYVAKNKDAWNSFFREIAEQEKRNMQILGITTAAAKQKLRSVVQNKAILLYTKG